MMKTIVAALLSISENNIEAKAGDAKNGRTMQAVTRLCADR
jgi:hypothetical protein